MRYVVALIAAGLIIGAATLYVRQVSRSFEKRVRESLRQAQKAGQLPPDIDLETTPIADMGLVVSAAETRDLAIVSILTTFRTALIPMVILGCLAAARLSK